MKYMLLVYIDPETQPPADAQARWAAGTERIAADGALLGHGRLEAVETARTVRRRGGETLVTDGPFAETKEHLLGYYVVDAPDVETAVAYAQAFPAVERGAMEIRPLLDTPADA